MRANPSRCFSTCPCAPPNIPNASKKSCHKWNNRVTHSRQPSAWLRQRPDPRPSTALAKVRTTTIRKEWGAVSLPPSLAPSLAPSRRSAHEPALLLPLHAQIVDAGAHQADVNVPEVLDEVFPRLPNRAAIAPVRAEHVRGVGRRCDATRESCPSVKTTARSCNNCSVFFEQRVSNDLEGRIA